jgi:hypothetical protein
MVIEYVSLRNQLLMTLQPDFVVNSYSNVHAFKKKLTILTVYLSKPNVHIMAKIVVLVLYS